MAIDQALHNTPKEWQAHQDLITKIAQAAARGEVYSTEPKNKSTITGKDNAAATSVIAARDPKTEINSYINTAQIKVKLSTKEFSWSLLVEDLCITDAYVAMVLPKNVEIQDMRMKAKLVLGINGADYPVMYIGGNFEFNSIPALPPLRILSFVRISGNISK